MGRFSKNENGFSAVEGLLVLIIVVLIGVVGWFVYKDHIKAKKASVTSTSNAKPVSADNTVTKPKQPVDPYAGWQSFTSKVFGYSLRYPSSWSIEGYNFGGSPLPSAELSDTANQLLLYSGSSKTNTFGVWITEETGYETSTIASGSGFGPLAYPAGSIIKTLPNGMNLWEQTEQNTTTQQSTNPHPTPDFELVTNGQFGYKLSNGKYMQVSMGYGYAFKQGTTYSYSQQSSSTELQQAESILSSVTQN